MSNIQFENKLLILLSIVLFMIIAYFIVNKLQLKEGIEGDLKSQVTAKLEELDLAKLFYLDTLLDDRSDGQMNALLEKIETDKPQTQGKGWQELAINFVVTNLEHLSSWGEGGFETDGEMKAAWKQRKEKLIIFTKPAHKRAFPDDIQAKFKPWLIKLESKISDEVAATLSSDPRPTINEAIEKTNNGDLSMQDMDNVKVIFGMSITDISSKYGISFPFPPRPTSATSTTSNTNSGTYKYDSNSDSDITSDSDGSKTLAQCETEAQEFKINCNKEGGAYQDNIPQNCLDWKAYMRSCWSESWDYNHQGDESGSSSDTNLITIKILVHNKHPVDDFEINTLSKNDTINELKFTIYKKIYESEKIEIPIEEIILRDTDEFELINPLNELHQYNISNNSQIALSFSQDNGPLNDKPCPEGCSTQGLNYLDEHCYDFNYNYEDKKYKLCKPKCVGKKSVSKNVCINSEHCNKCPPYRVYSLTDGRYHTRDSWAGESEVGINYSTKMLYDYIKNKWYPPCKNDEPGIDDEDSPFDAEFSEISTPENAHELKSAYADDNELKAYQAEWDINLS